MIPVREARGQIIRKELTSGMRTNWCPILANPYSTNEYLIQ